MLVRRLGEAPVEEWHRLRAHLLMDAGELGARNLTVSWLVVPVGAIRQLAIRMPEPARGRFGFAGFQA